MSWYRSGTVTVANGSPTIAGAGTDFVSNVQSGEAFRGPDGRTYEIAAVVSATQLTLAEAYLGGSGGGQAYAIQPTASFARDLALGAAQLLNSFAAVRDGIGQGLIAPGAVGTPGLRFVQDQDTGVYHAGENSLGIAAGGVATLWAGPQHLTLVGAPNAFNATGADREYSVLRYLSPVGSFRIAEIAAVQPADTYQDAADLVFRTSLATLQERMRIDKNGTLLVGVTASPDHTIARAVPQGSIILRTHSSAAATDQTLVLAAVASYAPNGAGAAAYLGHSSATGRSINAGGTINASGADYAEYMTKAAGCGDIDKGDVCGVDVDGRLTKTWAEARSFVVKSTDPAYVGGDVWGQTVGPRPDGPGAEPPAPIAPVAPADDGEAALAAWHGALVLHAERVAAFPAIHAAWAEAKAAYDTGLAAWEAALEAERQKVDRIAFAGQVPVNVAGDFAVGDYLIAAPAGAGIKAVAVPEADITFDQYRRRIGKVWAVRDGRAWVDVQHG